MAGLDIGSAENLSFDNRPSPLDFITYLPWACENLMPGEAVVVTKIVQKDYVSEAFLQSRQRRKSKINIPMKVVAPSTVNIPGEKSKSVLAVMRSDYSPAIRVLTEYSDDRLVQVKLLNNKCVPKEVIQIIILIVQFHIYLRAMTINRGINKDIVNELNKLLSVSRITDLCLDNCFVSEGNYHILLENKNHLSNLSLRQCKINDTVVRNMACLMAYPLPASKTLCLLNLASNQISDEGAKYLAEALRSNRQMCYLNLSGNRLTDTGAEAILNTMLVFPMTVDETLEAKKRYMHYLKDVHTFTNKTIIQLKAEALKKKPIKSTPPSSGKKGKGQEKETLPVPFSSSDTNIIYNKAKAMAESNLGEYDDPFMTSNTFPDDGILYSNGSNGLAYLNIAYNNLSYCTLKLLVAVLEYQRKLNRRPKGLVNVNIEGNPMPVSCMELYKIDDLLEPCSVTSRKQSVVLNKKRIQPATKTK